MALALDEPKENDFSEEFDGITYLLDKKLADQIGEVSVDFVEKGWRSGFVISTAKPITFGAPNCGSGCAC